MGRSGLDKNRKFLRLAGRLAPFASGMGDVLARGILETMWGMAYERADDHLGDAEDVELACGWRGPPSELFDALISAGGTECAGFIESDPDRGGYRIHSLWEHAPPWVQKKAATAAKRAADGQTIAAIRSAAGKRGRDAQLVRANGGQTVEHLPANGWQSVGKPSASGVQKTTRDGTGRVGTGSKSIAQPAAARVTDFDFDALYARYPRKLGKTRGMKLAEARIKTADDFDDLGRAIDAYARSVAGKDREYVKHFDTFMGCWRDFLDVEAQEVPGHDAVTAAAIARHNAAVLASAEANVFDDEPGE